MILEIGMGTDIRGADSTKAAVRGLRDALWHNSVNLPTALGLSPDDMHVAVKVGVPRPETVDKQAILDQLPHGTGEVEVVDGGLEIANEAGDDSTLIANVSAIIYLDVPA
jgi:uncharacterized protein (TIGR02058 family)